MKEDTIVCPKCKKAFELKTKTFPEKIISFIFNFTIRQLKKEATLKFWQWIFLTFIIVFVINIIF